MERSSQKIFVLDNDDFFLHSIKVFLLRKGYVDITLLRKPEVLFSKLGEKPDVVILDHFSEGKVGQDVLVKLRSITDKFKIIYLSSQKTDKITLRSVTKGAFAYLEKNTKKVKGLHHIVDQDYDGQSNYYQIERVSSID